MVDISSLTTLGTPTTAQSVIEITSSDQLSHLYDRGIFRTPYYILGSGANVLFTKDFPGNILLVKILGKKIISQNDTDVLAKFGAGESWHESVMWAVGHNWSGMENMALIPGTVGAAAVGNIAAYGQNQEDIFEHLVAFNLATGKSETFTHDQCGFAYRESIFNKKLSGKYLITSVTYKLSKSAHINLSYNATRHPSLKTELERLRTNNGAGLPENSRAIMPPRRGAREHEFSKSEPYTVQEVAQAVINLRTSKLPDWTKLHTAGSFFKNPVVTKEIAQKVKEKIPDLQLYPAQKLSYAPPGQQENFVKLPAGMLLDFLGWKSKKVGKVGTHSEHALVIVADAGATGAQIYEFTETMRADVKKNFGIDLEYEVVIV